MSGSKSGLLFPVVEEIIHHLDRLADHRQCPAFGPPPIGEIESPMGRLRDADMDGCVFENLTERPIGAPGVQRGSDHENRFDRMPIDESSDGEGFFPSARNTVGVGNDNDAVFGNAASDQYPFVHVRIVGVKPQHLGGILLGLGDPYLRSEPPAVEIGCIKRTGGVFAVQQIQDVGLFERMADNEPFGHSIEQQVPKSDHRQNGKKEKKPGKVAYASSGWGESGNMWRAHGNGRSFYHRHDRERYDVSWLMCAVSDPHPEEAAIPHGTDRAFDAVNRLVHRKNGRVFFGNPISLHGLCK